MHPHYHQAQDETPRPAQVRSLTDSAVNTKPSASSPAPAALRPRTLQTGTPSPSQMRHSNSLFFENYPSSSSSRLMDPHNPNGAQRPQSFYPQAVVGFPPHRQTLPPPPPPRVRSTPATFAHVPPPPPLPPPPVLHRSHHSALPPVPPKFPVPSPEAPSPPIQEERTENITNESISRSPTEDERKRQEREEEEAEELAKAMEASVLHTGPPVHAFVTSMQMTQSPIAIRNHTELSTPSSSGEPVRLQPPRCNKNQIEDDELLARRLAEEEQSNAERITAYELEDEALARKLAEEEEKEPSVSPKGKEVMKDSPYISAASSSPPRYIDVASGSNSTEKALNRSSSASSTGSRNNSITSSPEIYAKNDLPLSRTHSAEQLPPFSKGLRSTVLTASTLPTLGETQEPSDYAVSANNFIGSDLLNGVSINFVAPVIAPYLVPMAGPMPNIISLPFGRCPPLHIQAPNWKHMLSLLARLSGTRIEPTVEAVAMNKGDLRLRVIVQTVRTHQSSNDWRTILWLTIDHPVPPQMPGAQKYLNGDPTILPFSYSLSNPPALLRDGHDTPMAKYYTIPATESIPYPTLPITFPNLAAYLQAALRESRRYMSDSSSGMRRLAKMLDTCYPSRDEDSLYPTENVRTSLGVSKVFKRVMRRDKNGRKTRGENDDSYLLVTPFVADEWGG